MQRSACRYPDFRGVDSREAHAWCPCRFSQGIALDALRSISLICGSGLWICTLQRSSAPFESGWLARGNNDMPCYDECNGLRNDGVFWVTFSLEMLAREDFEFPGRAIDSS
jgi:hypothetical protein